MKKIRPRTGIMTAYPFDWSRVSKWGYPIIIQPKLDGDRAVAKKINGEWKLFSSTGIERVSVPHIIKALNELPPDVTILDGELYNHGMTHDDIRSIVSRTANLHPDHGLVEYHIFDVPIPGYSQSTRILTELDTIRWDFGYPLIWVEHEIATDSTLIEDYLTFFTRKGYEGIILRNMDGLYEMKRSTNMMKWKPRKKDSYRIVGYEEEHDIYDKPKGTLGALICEKDGERFKVGSGFDRLDREIFWTVRDKLIGKWVEIWYKELSGKRGVPREPIYCNIVEVGDAND